MLFKLSDKPVREDNNDIDAIPEFRLLTDKQLRYVILLTDYDTPLRQLPYKERQEEAAELAGFARENAKKMGKQAREMMNGKVYPVEKAIAKYKSLQRDLDRETLQAFDDQLEEFIKKTSEKKTENKDWDVALKIMNALPKLLGMRKEIKDSLNLKGDFDEKDDTVSEAELSTLDRINQKMIDESSKG